MDLIQSFGYAAIAAPNGMEAMKLIEEIPSITMVFTDIAMPGLDGIMLADMVKQHRPKLKILYTTGGNSVAAPSPRPASCTAIYLQSPIAPTN